MKFGVVNKSTILNRFVLNILQRNIKHLAVITRKRNIKLGILKGGGGGLEKSQEPKLNLTWLLGTWTLGIKEDITIRIHTLTYW